MEKLALKSAIALNSMEIEEALQQETCTQPSPQTHAEECSTAADQPIEQWDYIVAEATCACCLERESVILSDDLNQSLALNNSESIIENAKVITGSLHQKYFYPMKYEEHNKAIVIVKHSNSIQQHNLENSLKNTLGIDKGVKVFKIKMNFKNKIRTSLMLETIHKHLDPPISNELSDSYPSSNDLDVLMDFAFLQKEQRNFLEALKFFQQALRLYPDSEAAPFLVMEVGTILKNLGSYNEAIEIFTKGRLLPGVINNSMLEQEFINNIAYLRIINNILVENSLKVMPFNLIPENAFKEINAEFSEWRNQS